MYVAFVYIDDNHLDGVAKKVLGHQVVFEEFFDVGRVYYCPRGICVNGEVFPYNHQHRRIQIISLIKQLLLHTFYNALYLRYPLADYFLLDLLKRYKQKRLKIVAEVPTYLYNGNLLCDPRILIPRAVDGIFRRQIRKYVDRIVTYSDDDMIFGIPTIRTLNGIIFADTPPVDERRHQADELHLIVSPDFIRITVWIAS